MTLFDALVSEAIRNQRELIALRPVVIKEILHVTIQLTSAAIIKVESHRYP